MFWTVLNWSHDWHRQKDRSQRQRGIWLLILKVTRTRLNFKLWDRLGKVWNFEGRFCSWPYLQSTGAYNIASSITLITRCTRVGVINTTIQMVSCKTVTSNWSKINFSANVWEIGRGRERSRKVIFKVAALVIAWN